VNSEDIDFWVHFFCEYPHGPATEQNAFNFAKLMMHLDRILGTLKSVNGIKHVTMALSWVLPKRLRPKSTKSVEIMSSEDLAKSLTKKVEKL